MRGFTPAAGSREQPVAEAEPEALALGVAEGGAADDHLDRRGGSARGQRERE
jgi:hypothetical protein